MKCDDSSGLWMHNIGFLQFSDITTLSNSLGPIPLLILIYACFGFLVFH